MATADKLTYLNGTKNQIKKVIEEENLVTIDDTTTFREYADKIKSTNEEIKKYVPTDSQSGISLKVTNAVPLNIKKGVIDGNSYQGTTLPSEYTQVDYIESDGASYVDTNYIPNANTNINTKVYISDYSLNRNYICGAYGPNIEGRYQVTFGQVAEDANFMWCRGTYIGRMFIPEDFNLFLIKTDKSKITIKDKTINLTDEFIGTSNNLFLFANNSNGNVGSLSSGVRIYYFKIYENNTVVRDFIPCYRNSDNSIGLYDLVNDVFYENQGTGTFTYGSVATIPNPDYPQEIEVVSSKNLIGLGNLVNGYVDITQGGRWLNTASGKTYIFETSKLPSEVTISGNGNRSNVSYYNTMPEQYQIADSFSTTNYKYLPRTIEVDKNYKYIFIQVAYEMYNTELHMQLEKGDVATEILPFNNLLLTNSGKNICPTDISMWESGHYDVNGIKVANPGRIRTIDLLPIKQNSYYAKCSGYSVMIKTYDKDKNFVRNAGIVTSFTVEENEKYIGVSIGESTGKVTFETYQNGFADGTIQPLICLSSYEDKTFEPYRETDNYLIDLKENFLAKIGDVKDELELTSGVLNKNIKKVVLDGVNNKSTGRVSTYNNGSYQFIFNLENSYKTSNNNEKAKIICDKLIARNRNETHGAPQIGGKSFEGIAPSGLTNTYYGNGCVIYRDKWASYTTAQVNEDLQNDPLTLYYQVAETETIQLDPITIKMYDGTNNIELDTNSETNMSLDYYKDYTLDSQEVEVSGVTE